MPYTLESGLVVTDLAIPTAGRAAAPGDEVTIEYTLALTDGTVVDSTDDRGEPVTFELGAGLVPAGFDEGIVGMIELGRRRLGIPPELGFGPDGAPPRIPPAAHLTADIELVELEPVLVDETAAP